MQDRKQSLRLAKVCLRITSAAEVIEGHMILHVRWQWWAMARYVGSGGAVSCSNIENKLK